MIIRKQICRVYEIKAKRTNHFQRDKIQQIVTKTNIKQKNNIHIVIEELQNEQHKHLNIYGVIPGKVSKSTSNIN